MYTKDGEETEITLGNVLAFFTSFDQLPSQGLNNKLLVRFTGAKEALFPKSSTCSMQVTFPKSAEYTGELQCVDACSRNFKACCFYSGMVTAIVGSPYFDD